MAFRWRADSGPIHNAGWDLTFLHPKEQGAKPYCLHYDDCITAGCIRTERKNFINAELQVNGLIEGVSYLIRSICLFPITTAADGNFCNIFLNFQKIRYDTGRRFSMKYHALFVIYEKVARF